MLLSEGQMSDHKGASLVLDALPPAKNPLSLTVATTAAPFRQALSAKGIPALHSIEPKPENPLRLRQSALSPTP